MYPKKGVVVVLTILFAVSSFVFINEMTEAENSRMVFLTKTGFKDFSNFRSNTGEIQQWKYLVYSGLLARSTSITAAWVPDLAESVPKVKINPDKTGSISFKLKPNLKFASGNDLTVEDVIFSYQVYMTPAINIWSYDWYSDFFESNSSFTAEGDTIHFEFQKTDFNLYNFFYEAIIEKKAFLPIYEQCIAGETDKCYWDNSNGFFAQGAGPYKFKWFKNSTSQEVLIEKNPYFWDKDNVLVNEILYKYVPDISTALSMAKNETVDLLDQLYTSNSTVFDDNEKINLIVNDRLTSGIQVVLMNHRHPIFGTGISTPIGQSNVNQAYLGAKYVRKALNHVFDKNWIKEEIYGGIATVPTTIVSKGQTGHNENLKGYEYNISQAKTYLENAGYDYSTITEDDGIYDDYFFELKLFSFDNNLKRIQYSNQFVYDAAKIGIYVNYTQYNGIKDNDFLSSINLDTAENGGYDLFAMGWLVNTKSWVPDTDYSDESIDPINSSFWTWNWINYSNNTLSILIQSYLSQPDVDDRISILVDIQDHFLQEAVYIPIVNPFSIYGLHCRAQGIEDLFASEGQSWKGFKIDYSQCPNGVGPDPLRDIINSPAIYLIVPGGISGLLLIGVLVNQYTRTKVKKEIRELPAKERAMAKDYLEKARKIAEEGGDIEEDQYPEDYSDID